MRDPAETPDRRPMLYGLFAIAILSVAAYLFWPRQGGPGDLNLTPESLRTTPVASEVESTAADEAADRAALADLGEEAVELADDAGPAAETKIVDATPKANASPPPASPKQTTPTPKTPASASSIQPAASGEWVLNLGSFSTRENAERSVSELARKGVKAHVQPGQAKTGAVYRVRVGYFPTSAAAKTYGEWLKKSQNLDSWAGQR